LNRQLYLCELKEHQISWSKYEVADVQRWRDLLAPFTYSARKEKSKYSDDTDGLTDPMSRCSVTKTNAGQSGRPLYSQSAGGPKTYRLMIS
jgi:hypothetical protein